jgi:hypothetical protein
MMITPRGIRGDDYNVFSVFHGALIFTATFSAG